MRSIKAVSTAALLATATVLVGCSSEADNSADVLQWDAANPCELASAATLEPLLTTGLTEGAETSQEGSKICNWGSPEKMNTVSIELASAPQGLPELRTINVVGRNGLVLAESKYQCTVEFETDSGVLNVEAKFGFDAMANPDSSCNRVVPLTEEALEALAWDI